MFPSFIITLRETLEAALIVGIIYGYLKRTQQTKYLKTVWLGVASGVSLSLFGAIIFNQFAGGFSGRAEELFEGIAMIIGALLITSLIFWMMRRQDIIKNLESSVAKHVAEAHELGIYLLVLVAILREGIETILFLQAASLVSTDQNLLGALLGIIIALVLGYSIYAGSLHIKIKQFFTITGIILMLFAAGLFAHGVHELQEAGVLPVFMEEVWDINPDLLSNGGFPLLHENGYIGSFFKGLFGYNGNPSLLELLTYITSLGAIIILWQKVTKTPSSVKTN